MDSVPVTGRVVDRRGDEVLGTPQRATVVSVDAEVSSSAPS